MVFSIDIFVQDISVTVASVDVSVLNFQ